MALESKGWDPGSVQKDWRSRCHRLSGHSGLATLSRPSGAFCAEHRGQLLTFPQ